MSIVIRGIGAVSAAGWGVPALREAIENGVPLPTEMQQREGTRRPLEVRPVPKPEQKLPFARHPRMRRSSPISRYAVAAALEAVGEQRPESRIGVVFTSMNGSVKYSNRFYGEVLENPSVASPILFPETVFNAPASHVSAVFGSAAPNYSLPGDSVNFIPAIEIAVRWLLDEKVDGCVVIGTEEADWVSSEAAQLFQRGTIISEGAGAIYLERGENGIAEIESITDAVTVPTRAGRLAALEGVRKALPDGGHVIDFGQGATLPAQSILGESMGAGLALEIVHALSSPGADRISVSASGHSQQCVGCAFVR